MQRLPSGQRAEARAAATADVSALADFLMSADICQRVLGNIDLHDLSVCDATCTALAAVTDARWREVCGKRWPKSMARRDVQQVAEGMGHRRYFLWRVRNWEEHIREAFSLALKGDAAGMRQMLDMGKGVNGTHPFIGRRMSPIEGLPCISGESPGDDGQTVLHAAVWVHAVEVVQLLVEADGVDLSACTRCGFTPLHYAAARYDKYMCKLLVENGANHEMGTVVSKYAQCELQGCRCRSSHCGGMPVDNAGGEAKDYLESLSYSRRG